MTLIKLTCFLFLCLILTNCKSPSDHIKDAFNKVNDSLEKSNYVLKNSLKNVYQSIYTKRTYNQSLALNADTIYFVANNAANYLDSLRLILQQKDSSGTDLDLATKLFVNSRTGNELATKLLDVYTKVNSYSIDNSNRRSLDSSLQSIKEIQSDENWTKKYFETTPTIAAITILTKFKNDCVNAATITLSDIDRHLKK